MIDLKRPIFRVGELYTNEEVSLGLNVGNAGGSLQPYSHGAIVTTSFYSKAAISEAIAPAKKPIVLVNGLEFSAVLAHLGVELVA